MHLPPPPTVQSTEEHSTPPSSQPSQSSQKSQVSHSALKSPGSISEELVEDGELSDDGWPRPSPPKAVPPALRAPSAPSPAPSYARLPPPLARPPSARLPPPPPSSLPQISRPPPPQSQQPQSSVASSTIAGWHHTYYGLTFVAKEYQDMGKLGEGTFGEVYKAKHLKSGRIVALKKILMHNEKEGFPVTALREIRILQRLRHENVIELLEMTIERPVWEKNTKKRGLVFMVSPFMDNDLAMLLENRDVTFSIGQIKGFLDQLLKGTAYLHDSQILHRDMKAANILISNEGILKIADFGLARRFDEDPPSPNATTTPRARREYTKCVVTRWYRPPELLLGERRYTCAIDMWGVGCIFGEMYKKRPILAGNSDIDQLQREFQLCGTPTAETMPGWTSLPDAQGIRFPQFPRTLEKEFDEIGPVGVELLAEMLKLDPCKRITAHAALKHKFFTSRPLPRVHELTFKTPPAPPPPPPAPLKSQAQALLQAHIPTMRGSGYGSGGTRPYSQPGGRR
ncbi:kinase-like domain-containing protein [Limtongia smithiae]|uniref:kinase-like domain-containing protein n=1 Tax=Limtongia smithiae TaxID=1125753 RepID=UPI0034CEE1D8